MRASVGRQPNPLWRPVLAVGIAGAVAIGLVGVLLLRAGPFVPAAERPARVVVQRYVAGSEFTDPPRVTGRPMRRFEYLGARPAAVLDLDGVDFGSRTFRAAWYDRSGESWGSVVGRRKQDFARPIPVEPGFIVPAIELTFVFGSWDPGRERFERIYARTDIRVVRAR